MSIPLCLNLLHTFHNLPESSQKFFIAHRLLVNLKPLVDLHQMRGGKQAGVLSRRGQNRGQKSAHRALSVCPRHMQNFHLILGILQSFQDSSRILQRILLGKFRRLVNICDSLLIGHGLVVHRFLSPEKSRARGRFGDSAPGSCSSVI